MLGMLLSQLDEGTFREILFLYDEIIGGRLRKDKRFSGKNSQLKTWINHIEETLKRTNAAEFRFGSGKSGEEANAKLFIWEQNRIDNDTVIRFSFDPNLMRRMESAMQKVRVFENDVDYFLFSRGIAVYPETYEQRMKLDGLLADLGANGANDGVWIKNFLAKMKDLKERIGCLDESSRKRVFLYGVDEAIEAAERAKRNITGMDAELSGSHKRMFSCKLAVLYEIIGWPKTQGVA